MRVPSWVVALHIIQHSCFSSRGCYTVQFGQQLAMQHWKMFLLQLPRWGVTPCNAIWATCNDLYRESLAIFAAVEPESVVGRIYKEINACSGKIALKVAGGCYTVQWQLQVATIVAKSRTGFYFVQRCAQRKKDVLQVAEVPCYTAQFFSNLQRNGVALQVAVKIVQCNGALTLSLLRVINVKFLL